MRASIVLTFIFSLLFCFTTQAQIKTDAGLGIGAIRLGTPKSKIASLLESAPIAGYYSRKELEEEEMSEETYKAEMARIIKDFPSWKVKVSGEYATYFGAKVEFIEVDFDENNNVSGIDIFIEDVGTNAATVWEEFNKVFGEQSCPLAYDGDPETGEMTVVGFTCWWDEHPGVELFTWNGWGMSIFDEYLYVRFMLPELAEH